ncbi:MAG TPA: hypothetical protein VGV09_18000 [Steroidobacteraceae bacterium]|nr:hypothetical protein [Steroidobacteraceae bacterium]
MSEWIIRNRILLFAACNILLDLAVAIRGPANGSALGRMLYVGALFALCSAPLTLLKSFNGRHILLMIFMCFYFMDFGGLDLQSILTGLPPPQVRGSLLTPAEVAVLACGVLLFAGYLVAARGWGEMRTAAAAAEWSAASMFVVGVILWTTGTLVMVYMGVFVTPDASKLTVAQGLTSLGPLATFAVMLGRLMQPLGLLIVAYGFSRFGGVAWTALIIAVIIVQAAAGFLTDTKQTAMMGILMVVVTRLLVRNRLPVAWLIVALVSVALAFPVFQANRQESTGELGMNRLQAFNNLGKVVALALASRDKVQNLRADERPPTFVERTFLKPPFEQVIAHVGDDVPYLHGASLVDLPLAFVPRLILSDKPTLNIAQLYTHQIARSDEDTYISISHMGDLYWNFGWTGMLAGMLATGVILGLVGAGSSLEQGPSLTRVMVLLVTVQTLCIGFEGEVSTSYVVWMRSLAAIGLLHLMFARRPSTAVALRPAATPSVPVGLPVRFPNIMH